MNTASLVAAGLSDAFSERPGTTETFSQAWTECLDGRHKTRDSNATTLEQHDRN